MTKDLCCALNHGMLNNLFANPSTLFILHGTMHPIALGQLKSLHNIRNLYQHLGGYIK